MARFNAKDPTKVTTHMISDVTAKDFETPEEAYKRYV